MDFTLVLVMLALTGVVAVASGRLLLGGVLRLMERSVPTQPAQ